MIPDIYINDVSMLSLDLIRESIDFPVPKAQMETVIVPGRNSPIRFNEALGSVTYEPRAFSITLSMLGTRKLFDEKTLLMANRYNGKLCKVKTSEEPNLYALGTLQLDSSYDPFLSKGQIIIECTDGDSYRYHEDITEIVKVGAGTVILENDYMPVVPSVVTTEETTLDWKIGEDSFSRTLSAGTWEISELELFHGTNSINVTGNGKTTFRYREGCL
jgi:hypothetical protein